MKLTNCSGILIIATCFSNAQPTPQEHEQMPRYVGSAEFTKLSALVDSWEGTLKGGPIITATYRRTSGGSAVMGGHFRRHTP